MQEPADLGGAADGVVVDVPLGAATAPGWLWGDPADGTPTTPVAGFPDEFEPRLSAESAWTFGPSDLALGAAVSIKLPYEGEPYDDGPIPILEWDDGEQTRVLARRSDGASIEGIPVSGGVRFEIRTMATLAFVRMPPEVVECVGSLSAELPSTSSAPSDTCLARGTAPRPRGSGPPVDSPLLRAAQKRTLPR